MRYKSIGIKYFDLLNLFKKVIMDVLKEFCQFVSDILRLSRATINVISPSHEENPSNITFIILLKNHTKLRITIWRFRNLQRITFDH